jgi:hypothetical protein
MFEAVLAMPTVANLDARAAVISAISATWVGALVANMLPNSIRCTHGVVRGMTMVQPAWRFFQNAPTGLRVAAMQGAAVHFDFLTTGAQTKPQSVPVVAANASNCFEPPVHAPSSILVMIWERAV